MAQVTMEQAERLIKANVTEQHLFTHARAVSAAMGAMAEHFGADKVHWEAVGYLHDVDYEKFPEEHLAHTRELLSGEDIDESDIRAILSHGYGICTDVEPQTDMEKSLFAVDELTGIVQAASLMRPTGITDLEVKSLKKKYKDKKFAAGCSRDVINTGAERLGWELDELLQRTIEAMRSCEASVASAMQEEQ